MESEERKRVWTQWKALRTLGCAVPCSIPITPIYIHVYLDATGCMVQHVGLYMFKVLAIPWRCVECIIAFTWLTASFFVVVLIDMDEKIWMCLVFNSERTFFWYKHIFTNNYLIVPSLWVSLFLSDRGWMLNNECHSVLTYQSIRFYSHVSAAVEKKIDIKSKHTKTTIWGGRGGGVGVLLSATYWPACVTMKRPSFPVSSHDFASIYKKFRLKKDLNNGFSFSFFFVHFF